MFAGIQRIMAEHQQMDALFQHLLQQSDRPASSQTPNLDGIPSAHSSSKQTEDA
jgi:hypothetical protein